MPEFHLSVEQERAFKSLERAYTRCIQSGIIFYNNYGALGALNGKVWGHYNDDPTDGIEDTGQNMYEIELACTEWADDTHFFHPKQT